jgi:hypothetical protein
LSQLRRPAPHQPAFAGFLAFSNVWSSRNFHCAIWTAARLSVGLVSRRNWILPICGQEGHDLANTKS